MKHAPYWRDAAQHLAKNDAKLAPVIQSYPGEFLQSRGSPFYTLARSIIGQQISVKAADTLTARVEGAYELHHDALADAPHEHLLTLGLSRQKARYLIDTAAWFRAHGTALDWHTLSDDEIRTHLLALKGIGPWTVEMFLIFCLMRPDVLPVGDIGLQKAFARLHPPRGKSEEPRPDLISRLQRHAEKHWKPYRTVATWYLWRSLDPVPVCY